MIAAVDSTDWGRFSTMLALAIRTGHTLQLHRLTDDPESMPGGRLASQLLSVDRSNLR